MAMATSRMSFDPPPSLIGLPPLVNPHALPNLHVGIVDHSQTRRVSSESQAPGRASPSPRITRRTPVPFLLEAFPAPPSHIPGTPASVSPSILLNGPSLLASAAGLLASASSTASSAASTSPVCSSNSNVISPCSPKSVATILLAHGNPPPSSPPTGPLPPIPGPSTVTPDLFTTYRAFQTASRSASPALSRTESQRSQPRSESRPRQSLDSNEPVRGRHRQGSLSSLRNPVYPIGEQSQTITEEPVEEPCSLPPPPAAAPQSPPLSGSVAERKSHDQSRDASLDILCPSLFSVAATALLRPDDMPRAEDSIARVDMSDLNAIKSDNEGEGEERASRPFPRFPPLPHSQPQSPIASPPPAPPYVHTPRKPSTSEDVDTRQRTMSPEIAQIISATPGLQKRSTSSRSRDPSTTRSRPDSAKNRRRADVPPVPTSSQIARKPLERKAARGSGDDGGICMAREDEANESDSSLDLHTPLPQLMLRHGMLSPNSKLLPQPEVDPARLSIMSGFSSSSFVSNASNLSLISVKSTSSKHLKDARDTPQRRVRHRDGRLLKGGIGLTTGLGWSDSEDEDAPSPLTRRVSTLVVSRHAASSSVASASSQALARSISHTILREADEQPDADEFGYARCSSVATRSLPSRSKPASRVGSVRSIGSSLGRYSIQSASSAAPTGRRARAGSGSGSSIYAASVASSKLDASSTDGTTALMPGIREYDDGVTPTRAAFERSSVGSLNGASPSSASSGSLPFPPTPEGGEDIPQLQLACNGDKVLPPLPLAARSRHPSTKSQPSGLPRPRTSSNASSVSNTSMLGVPPGDPKSRSASPTSTPRPLLAKQHAKTAIPVGSPRPSLSGTPRPSLTIPKIPLPSHSPGSAIPRPITPSLSPCANANQRHTPRPLRLVSRSSPPPFLTSPANNSPRPLSNQAETNQSSAKALQPGEQPPRPGQVLTYNRHVHDQLKLRSLALNTVPNRAQVAAVSPGGTQTMFVSSPGSSSVTSSPVTAQSQSPLASPSSGGEGARPKPRTGTGMMYRTNIGVATSRIRVPSTVSR